MSVPEYFELEGGDRMPRIGFGTWQASDDEVEQALEEALKAGYRHIDTACAYQNEAAIGRVLKRWINGDPVKRKELFVVTKLPPCGNRTEHVEKFFSASLKDLGLDYIDFYYFHTPFAFEYEPGNLHPTNPDGSMKVDLSTDLVAVWKTMLKLKESGRIRHIGVSNMNEEQINRLSAVYKPECLQVEVNVLFQQKSLVANMTRLGIPVVGYSPLGSKALTDKLSAKNGREYPNMMEIPIIKKIANAHSRTPAQVLLRFLLQSGIAVIPKSTNPTRIKQNISIMDFQLSQSEMEEIKALDQGESGRICDFAFFVGAEKHPEFPFKRS